MDTIGSAFLILCLYVFEHVPTIYFFTFYRFTYQTAFWSPNVYIFTSVDEAIFQANE